MKGTNSAGRAGPQTGTPAIVALTRAGISFTVHEYRHDPSAASYGTEAAVALGISTSQVFKTLVADVDGTLTVAVVPVSGELDLKALAHALGGKRAAMADPAAAARSSGYVLGGISPIGQRKQLRTVVDKSASDQTTVFVSAGRRGLEVELAAGDLVRITGAIVAPIGRPA
jgi:Cys-tRNA(Pro)/Cys-tRNA(Cys) deacylase